MSNIIFNFYDLFTFYFSVCSLLSGETFSTDLRFLSLFSFLLVYLYFSRVTMFQGESLKGGCTDDLHNTLGQTKYNHPIDTCISNENRRNAIFIPYSNRPVYL